MAHHIDATAAERPPASAATGNPAGWKLVEDAPASDEPVTRDRTGAAKGMTLLLVGGGLFWGAVAAAVWFAMR
jgi:hypothetical protein